MDLGQVSIINPKVHYNSTPSFLPPSHNGLLSYSHALEEKNFSNYANKNGKDNLVRYRNRMLSGSSKIGLMHVLHATILPA